MFITSRKVAIVVECRQIVLVRSAPKEGAARKPSGRAEENLSLLTRHSASQMRNRCASEKLRDRATFGRPAGLERGLSNVSRQLEMMSQRDE